MEEDFFEGELQRDASNQRVSTVMPSAIRILPGCRLERKAKE